MEKANVVDNTEYLEWFLQNDRYFSVNYIKSNYKFSQNLRITLDYAQDLIFFKKIFKYFNSINKKNFVLDDVIKYLTKNPKIANINNFLIPKFKTSKNSFGAYFSNDIDVSLKI